MMDVGRHPLINLLTYSEIEDISGFIGNFHIKVRKKARYVNEVECTACDECVDICPVAVPKEHQLGLATRKAIYIPFPQAVPSSYLIDIDACLGLNPIACGKCVDKCDKECIDYDDKDEIIDFDAGTIVVATGLDVYDPTEFDEFGYRTKENVLTSMEFEILTGPGGVTQGELIRPTDRKVPKSIGFIQCVGSRCDQRGKPYCSNICCMNTIKDTLLLKEYYHDIDCKVFYMDIRAFGKGFEDFYRRSKALGVEFIRGIPGDVKENPITKNLIVTVENTTDSSISKYELDMLVLSVGMVPRSDSELLNKLLTLSSTSDGFLMEVHPKLLPIDAPTAGVFFAGCCEAPKDIKDSVTQASGAAARAITILSKDKVKIPALTAVVDDEMCKFCGVCEKVCPYGAITIDTKAKSPAKVTEAACKGCGTCAAECKFDAIFMKHFSDIQIMAQIEAVLENDPQDKIVVFACNWCSYPGADLVGISRMQYPTSPRIIRIMCTGRLSEKFVLYALKLGAPIVLMSGCHPSDCHYINASLTAQLRIEKLWNKLDRKGIRPERVQFEWISASEVGKFVRTMKELEAFRKKVTVDEIEETKKILGKIKF